jgi:DNA anti-recombination protein RmuC
VLHGRPSSLAQFMDDMPKLGKQLSHTLDAINTFTQGSTKTVKSIKALSDSLKEDPSQILHGSPGGASGKGVEIPK